MNKYDKPASIRAARRHDPTHSMVQEQADAMLKRIMNATCAAPPEGGQKWYVSNSGNDANDGHTPETALETVDAVAARMQEGDSVLFECGSLFRGVEIITKSNMFFGSYGEGEKPCLYASPENSAQAVWTAQEAPSVWKLETAFDTPDVGLIVFNHGEETGTKQFAMEDLKEDLDFFFDGTYVYVFCGQNPGEAFYDIEVCPRINIFTINRGTYNVTIDNFSIRYTGWTGILGDGDTKEITIRNCEVGWCGGIIQKGTIRMGGGIGFWNGCQDTLIENCWVYQSYDSGISPQGNCEHVEKNIVVRNNLIEYCGYASYEYWVHPAEIASIENVLVTDNIMRFSGCGYGSRGGAPHIRSNNGLDNKSKDFIISNNIFEYAPNNSIIYCRSNVGTLPTLKGNRYIQGIEYGIGSYGGEFLAVEDAENAQRIVVDIFKDETGVFELYK